jgi:hypothetical protein
MPLGRLGGAFWRKRQRGGQPGAHCLQGVFDRAASQGHLKPPDQLRYTVLQLRVALRLLVPVRHEGQIEVIVDRLEQVAQRTGRRMPLRRI